MFHVVNLLLFLSTSCLSNDLFQHGRQKYDHLVLLSSSTETSSCWQRVLSMLHEHCSIDELENYQTSIAYQFTRCHLATMNNDDDSSVMQCSEENTDVCIQQLHQHMNAFIAYTEFYPFVQSVCHVLRQKSSQSELSSHLALFLENSHEIIAKLISSIDVQQKLTETVKQQQHIQATVVENALKLKHLARTNMGKTQDLLSNVIQAARHEYDLLKQICALSQTIQTIVRITCTLSFWFYALSMFAVYLVTIPKRTNRARSLLFCVMFVYVLLERYFQMSSIVNFYHWRLVCWTVFLLVLVRYACTYRSRAAMNNEQLSQITAGLEQTEATFHRVSRELKRARSRSRSRSARSRGRRQQQQLTSPLCQETSRPIDDDENKENNHAQQQRQLIDDEEDYPSINTSKRHYSLLVQQSSKSSRILLGSKQINNNS